MENRESTEVFRVESSATVDSLLLSPVEGGLSDSVKGDDWALARALGELPRLKVVSPRTTVEFEARPRLLSRSFLIKSLGAMPFPLRDGEPDPSSLLKATALPLNSC